MGRLIFAAGFAFSLLAYGAVSSVQVGDPSRQQGVVSFRVQNPNQCTVTVYLDAALSSKAEDTNNALFAGSESCARAYNIVTGNEVTAVVGRRTSELASDGKLHSRSLEVNRTYYVVITDRTDNNTASVSFTTANIPWGDTHIEEVPFSATGYNHWAYPDLDWSDAGESKWFVDPMSGVGVKRTPRNKAGSGGGWGNNVNEEFTFGGAFDIQSKWTNPQNALNGSTAGPFASYAGTAQAPLFLPLKADPTNSNSPGTRYTADSGYSLDDVRLNLYGYASDTGNAEDRKVLACLATQYSPLTNACASPEFEVLLPTAAGAVQLPSSYPSWQFGGWNIGHSLTQEEAAVPGADGWGGANVVNSAVTLSNYRFLPVWAAPGMKINLSGNWYTIGTIADAAHFTLQESNVNRGSGSYCGGDANACWYLGTFGIRIRKKTATNNQINVAASFSLAFESNPKMPANGVPDFCSPLTFPVTYAADGTTLLAAPKTGRLCYNGTFVFLLADDGESRYLSALKHSDASGSGINPSIPLNPFSATDAYSVTVMHTDDGGPSSNPVQKALYQVTYDYATCHFKAWGPWYPPAAAPPDCMVWTNRTPHSQGKSVTDQIAPSVTSSPLWDSSMTLDWVGLTSVSGRWATVTITLYQQNAPCFNMIFDTSTAPYTLVKTMEPMTGLTVPGFRWGGCHGVNPNIPPGQHYGAWNIDPLAWGGYVSGPYVNPSITAKSLDGGKTWNSDTSLATGVLIDSATSAGKCGPQPWTVGTKCVDLTNAATQCDTNPYGVTGYQCVWLKYSGDIPCAIAPSSNPNEIAKFGACPWQSGWAKPPGGMKLDAGDYIQESVPNGNGGYGPNGKGEKLRVLTKTDLGNGSFSMMMQRWAACDNPTSDPQGTPPACTFFTHLYDGTGVHGNGWMSEMSATAAGASTALWVNVSPGQTDWASDTSDLTVGHNTFGLAPDGTSLMQLGGDVSRIGTLPAMVSLPTQYSWSSSVSAFNGLVKGTGGEVESYPSSGNWAAATRQQRALMWDFRHINPDAGSSPEDPKQMWPHTYTLVSGQTFTYKMNIAFDLGDFKSRPVNVFGILSAFKNISGQGSTIDDTKPWSYCQAYVAGECRAGSAKGDLFVSAPVSAASSGYCVSDSYRTYSPCATPLGSHVGWMVEWDATKNDPLGMHFRRITMGLTGPTAQYQYTSPHMTPDGKFAMVRAGYLNGVRPDLLLVRMPPPASDDNIDRSTFVPVRVILPAGSGYVRVRFGYAENGAPGQFYCTSRQEACVTDSTMAPYAFAQSDTLTATDCRNGCTINVPGLSGRVVYFRVETSSDGIGWVNWPSQAFAVK